MSVNQQLLLGLFCLFLCCVYIATNNEPYKSDVPIYAQLLWDLVDHNDSVYTYTAVHLHGELDHWFSHEQNLRNCSLSLGDLHGLSQVTTILYGLSCDYVNGESSYSVNVYVKLNDFDIVVDGKGDEIIINWIEVSVDNRIMLDRIESISDNYILTVTAP